MVQAERQGIMSDDCMGAQKENSARQVLPAVVRNGGTEANTARAAAESSSLDNQRQQDLSVTRSRRVCAAGRRNARQQASEPEPANPQGNRVSEASDDKNG